MPTSEIKLTRALGMGAIFRGGVSNERGSGQGRKKGGLERHQMEKNRELDSETGKD